MNEDLQDEYALIVNEVGKLIDASDDSGPDESTTLDAIIKLLGNFNLRLSRVEERLRD
jgi:hypothetical protein